MKHLAIIGVSALVLALAGCGKAPESKPEEIRPVRVLKVGAAIAPRSIEYGGDVQPRHEARLSFRVGGKVIERSVEVGSRVGAGQPIARLDPADLALAVVAAKALVEGQESERALAHADLERHRELRARNFISQAEYDRRASLLAGAQARLESARAQLRQAENQVAYATLRAVSSGGVVTAVEVEAGQVVAAGQAVVRVARPGEKEVSVAVPETQRAIFEAAGEFRIELAARPGKSWQGKLREFSPMADPATRTYAARVTMVGAGEDVELGMSARVIMTTPAGRAGVELPISALYSRGDAPNVWLVDTAAGSVRLVPVKTGGLVGERIVVESGLNPGDLVVTAGAQLLREGQKVRVLEGGTQPNGR